jgi:hypothetical protein
MFILKISNAYNHLKGIVPNKNYQTYYQKYNIHPLLIAENAQCSYLYAKFHLKDKFPLGEHAIAKDAFSSITYAKMLGKRFKLGEKTILSSSIQYMVMYAIVIKERFLEAEKYIVTSSSYKRKYYNEMMKLGIRISKYNT